MSMRLAHLLLALYTLPGLLCSARRRRLFAEMRALSRELPSIMRQPLPQALGALAPQPSNVTLSEAEVRRLADLAALLARRSPLGLCLRRALLRYHFLGRAGLPLSISFGARFRSNGQSGTRPASRTLTGHAWVTLDGDPYHEQRENWRDYRVIYRWPATE